MSGQVAVTKQSAPRLFVLDGDEPHDVFEVLEVDHDVVRVRSPMLFEIGEELRVRLVRDGMETDTRARVRAHVGPADAQITELELVTTAATAAAPDRAEPG